MVVKIDEDNIEELFDFEYDVESISDNFFKYPNETIEIVIEPIPDTVRVITDWDGNEKSLIIITKI